MNILLSLTDNLQTFWSYTGFANAEGGHLIMILVGLVFIFFILFVLMNNIWERISIPRTGDFLTSLSSSVSGIPHERPHEPRSLEPLCYVA